MKTPPRLKSRWMLLPMVAISFSLVLGTFFLSNDMRHLRALADRLGIPLSTTVAVAEPEKLPVQAAAFIPPALLSGTAAGAAADHAMQVGAETVAQVGAGVMAAGADGEGPLQLALVRRGVGGVVEHIALAAGA